MPVVNPVQVKSSRQRRPRTPRFRAGVFNQIGSGLGRKPAHSSPQKASAPGAAPAPGVTPVAAPAAPAAPDPRDSTYFGQLAGLEAKRTRTLADLDARDADAQRDTDDQTKKLIEAHARNLMSAKQGANKRGLFYSTALTNTNTGLEKSKADAQAGLLEMLRRTLAATQGERDRVREELGQGDDYGTAGTDLFAEAIGRALAGDLAAPPPAAPVAPAASPAGLDSAAKSRARTQHATAVARAKKRATRARRTR